MPQRLEGLQTQCGMLCVLYTCTVLAIRPSALLVEKRTTNVPNAGVLPSISAASSEARIDPSAFAYSTAEPSSIAIAPNRSLRLHTGPSPLRACQQKIDTMRVVPDPFTLVMVSGMVCIPVLVLSTPPMSTFSKVEEEDYW